MTFQISRIVAFHANLEEFGGPDGFSGGRFSGDYLPLCDSRNELTKQSPSRKR